MYSHVLKNHNVLSSIQTRRRTHDLNIQNPEVFSLTYGALVMQLLKDYEDVGEVNRKLKQIGKNIGVRLVDEFLAKSNTMRCKSFKDTANKIGSEGFKLYLGFTAKVHSWNKDETECSMTIPSENALTHFVSLPEKCAKTLSYGNLICGVIEGALKMVRLFVRISSRSELTIRHIHTDQCRSYM